MTRKERNIRRGCFFGGLAIVVVLLCGNCGRGEETLSVTSGDSSAQGIFRCAPCPKGRAFATDTYFVERGDTLWSIAGECKPEGFDSREYIRLMYELNEDLTTKIVPGQAVVVPVME